MSWPLLSGLVSSWPGVPGPDRSSLVGHGVGVPSRRGGRGVLGDQVPPGRLLAWISGHLAITPVHSLPARLWARTKSRLPAKITVGIVVQRGHVVAVRALTHGELCGRQRGPQHLHTARSHHMVGRADVDQHRLGNLAKLLLGGLPQLRQGRRGPHRHPVIAQLVDALLLDVAADPLQRGHDELQHRRQQEQLGVGRDRGIHQHQPGHAVAAQLGHPQREAAPHRQAHQEDLVRLPAQFLVGPVHLREPVFPPGMRHVLPGRAVAGQPGQGDGQPGGGEVIGPRPQRRGGSGEPVAEQDPGAAPGVKEGLRPRHYWHHGRPLAPALSRIVARRHDRAHAETGSRAWPGKVAPGSGHALQPKATGAGDCR